MPGSKQNCTRVLVAPISSLRVFVAKPLANQCSALVRTAADANAIVTVRETAFGPTGLHRGEIIEVEVFDWCNVFRPSCETHRVKEAAA